MRKITQTIVGTTPPLDKNVLWLDTTNSNSPVEKVFLNGEWIPTSAAGGDYYTKDEVDENFMGKIDNPHVGNILVMDEDGKAVDSLTKPADFLANPEVSGQEGEVLSVDNDGNPVWTTITPTGTADTEMSDSSTNAVQNRVIKEYVDSNFARQNGWYDTLVSGAAKNLVGHGTTPAEYTFRTSGGNADIGTGTATIDVLKGKTLKWNQLVKNGNFSSGTDNWNSAYGTGSVSDGILTYTVSTPTNGRCVSQSNFPVATGHKFLLSMECKYSANPSATGVYLGVDGYWGVSADVSEANKWIKIQGIKTDNGNATSPTLEIYPRTQNMTAGDTVQFRNIKAIDLTLMFGAGNEPSTVAEFEALYPLDYYAYTATPVLINNAAKGIVTTGFNQWDEEWEVGGIDNTTGQNTTQTDRIRSKNYISCLGNTDYFFRFTSSLELHTFYVYYYDANHDFISYDSGRGNYVQTTPTNACYMRFRTYNDYGTTYNNDICINLSWSGYRNGEYEPYEKHTLYFNGESGSLATVTGKKIVNGEPTGESVYVWPEGMKGFGGKFDFGKADSDGYIRKVTKRIGVVDLGVDVSWGSTSDRLYGTIPNNKTYSNDTVGNGICTNYEIVTGNRILYKEKTGIALSSNLGGGNISAYDSNLTASQLISALSGVPLYYELATPEEYLLDTPIPANYIVNDFGTEQRIPVDTASNMMASISYECRYNMNATDAVRRLPINYVSAVGKDASTPSTLDNLLTCLGTALNGTFTKSSYDNENENYTFTFTPNETPGE